MKLCECGCGRPTKLRRGKFNSFLHGHHLRGESHPRWRGGIPRNRNIGRGNHANHCRGENHYRWNGHRKIMGHGYVGIFDPNHPRANKMGYVLEHVVLAEKALGRALPTASEVHHLNENKADNSRRNLVICENREYHALLHQRMKGERYG